MGHLQLTSPPENGGARPDAPPIRVVLAEAHSGIRRTMRGLLEHQDDVEVVAEISDAHGVIAAVAASRPHVLVLDLQMQDGSTVKLIRVIRSLAPDTAVVIVTMQIDRSVALGAINAGAIGYVLKERAARELASAVHCAAQGEQYLSPQIAATIGARPLDAH
jgi:DNA-binding NarL/FixJ family response regulator